MDRGLDAFYFLNCLRWLRAGTIEEIAGLDASYHVAVQEDHEELKTKIMEEYSKHKEALSSHSRRSTKKTSSATMDASGHSFAEEDEV